MSSGFTSIKRAGGYEPEATALGQSQSWMRSAAACSSGERCTADPERPRRIVQMPEDGGEPLVVFWPEEEQFGFQWVHGLPDGQGALVTACRGSASCGPGASDLYLLSLRDLSSELILEQVARAWYAPTGQLVYLQSDGAVLAAPFDLGALAITGGAVPLFDRVRVGGPNADMQLAADGTLLYVEGSSSGATAMQRLLVIDLDLKQAHRLPGHRIGCAVCRLGVCFDSRGRGLGFCVHRRGVSGRFTGPRGRVS